LLKPRSSMECLATLRRHLWTQDSRRGKVRKSSWLRERKTEVFVKQIEMWGRETLGDMSVICRWFVGDMSVICRQRNDQTSTAYRPTACSGRLSATYRPMHGRYSTDTRPPLDQHPADISTDMATDSRPRWRPLRRWTPPIRHKIPKDYAHPLSACRPFISCVSLL